MKEDIEINERDYVNSLARGLEVIRAFKRDRPQMTLTNIAEATGMTRASARRFLLTLVHEGYAEKEGNFFNLKPKILELGYSALSSMNMLEVIQPIINDMSKELNESVFVAVLTGHDVIYIARATVDRRISVGITVGNRGPAYGTSTGRVLLAGESDKAFEQYLNEVQMELHTPTTITSKEKLRDAVKKVRSDGYSMVDQEMEPGLRSISVPICRGGSKVIAALNVCCPASRISLDFMEKEILGVLQRTSKQISSCL
ncbi:IclR family transcriptional regulator domain-containing protein [Hyphococcus lacteus]|uniref:IclR family transcriptional regulator C-terminal domain-containing protein n=1 Tax=Hyphococcus lacteus TaxID=3143536 RepID=A0ABV3Z0G7_9PROT